MIDKIAADKFSTSLAVSEAGSQMQLQNADSLGPGSLYCSMIPSGIYFRPSLSNFPSAPGPFLTIIGLRWLVFRRCRMHTPSNLKCIFMACKQQVPPFTLPVVTALVTLMRKRTWRGSGCRRCQEEVGQRLSGHFVFPRQWSCNYKGQAGSGSFVRICWSRW